MGAIFILLASSAFATLFPVVTRRAPKLQVPSYVFDFCKYFGSGVIIATAFIHLLTPGAEELGSECLNETFQSYPFAFAFSMIAVFATFIVELVAFRVGASYAQKLAYDPHMGGHHHAAEHGNHAVADIQEGNLSSTDGDKDDVEAGPENEKEGLSAAASEILGVAILEFGVIFRECKRARICTDGLPLTGPSTPACPP